MKTDPEPEQNAKAVKNRFEQGFEKAVWLTLGAIISGIMGFAFFWYKRGRDAKDHFLVTLSQLGGELERTKDVLEFYDSTLSRTEEVVFRLRPFLRKSRREALSTFWNLYRQVRTALHQASDDNITHQAFWEYFSKRGYKEPATKRDIVKLFHKKFTEIAT
jgi:hypothetical protein